MGNPGNPLSESLGNQNPINPTGNRNIFTLMKEFNNFRKNFKGNPETTIQQMLNSGQLSQDKLDEGIKVAKIIQGFMR